MAEVPQARAAIFDLDGVLLDTEGLYSDATSQVLAAYGRTYEWSLKRRLMGRGDVTGGRLLIAELGLPISLEEYLARRELILGALFASARPMPGAPELVAELSRLRVPLAIATSSSADAFAIKARPHAFLQQFDTVVCGDDPAVAAFKPAPDIFLEAGRRLGVPAARCVVIEDSEAGVLAGKSAGMRVVAWPAAELGAAAVSSADRVVHGADELRQELLTWLRG